MDKSCHVTMSSLSGIYNEPATKRRILIIDPDRSTRRMLTAALESPNNDLFTARNAAEAIELTAIGPAFNCIVTALSQSGQQDCALIEKLRRGGERAPILALAAQWSLEALARALECGADDWLQKPFDIHEFRRSVAMLSSRSSGKSEESKIQYCRASVTASKRDGIAELELTAPTLSAHVYAFERFVERLAATLISPAELTNLHMALEELVQNAKEWGNRFDPKKRVRLGFRLSGDRIVVRVEDEGEGFDPESIPDPSIDPKAHIQRRLQSGKRMGGWGLFIARKRMDELSFNEAGNAASITKYLAPMKTPQKSESMTDTAVFAPRKSSRKALETRRFAK
jgi:DNA-binding response OmpR family regulator